MSPLGSAHHLPRPFRVLWELLPAPVVSLRAFRTLGALIYAHHTRYQDRAQSHSTWFMRNVPQLEVLCDLIARRARGSIVTIASIGCSTGAELYSALALVRAARPDLDVRATGVDISAGVVEAARNGIYRTAASAAEAAAFEGGFSEVADLSAEHRAILFTEHSGRFRVQDWIRKGTTWLVADASDPRLAEILKPHDIVLANNFTGSDGRSRSRRLPSERPSCREARWSPGRRRCGPRRQVPRPSAGGLRSVVRAHPGYLLGGPLQAGLALGTLGQGAPRHDAFRLADPVRHHFSST